jgi:hypothetical protein
MHSSAQFRISTDSANSISEDDIDSSQSASFSLTGIGGEGKV